MKQILYTIQHIAAYEEMLRTGTLRANEKYMLFDGEFRPAYDYMARMLRERVGKAPDGVFYPIWAWHTWEGKRGRRDLRCSGYGERGTKMVEIAFAAEEDSFLLSDFDAWHLVLANRYIGEREDIASLFEAPVTDLAKLDQITKRSWEKIFDLENPLTLPEDISLQACLWEVPISAIKKVWFFTAK